MACGWGCTSSRSRSLRTASNAWLYGWVGSLDGSARCKALYGSDHPGRGVRLAPHRYFPLQEGVHPWKSGKLLGVLGVLVGFQRAFRIVRWKTSVNLSTLPQSRFIGTDKPNKCAVRRGAQVDAPFGLQGAQTAVDGALALVETSCKGRLGVRMVPSGRSSTPAMSMEARDLTLARSSRSIRLR